MKPCIAFASCVLAVGLVLIIGCATAAPSGEVVTERGAVETPSVKADPVAGQAVFDTNCGSCHRAGRHGTEGKAPDIMGKTITARRLARHHGKSLSAADAANLRAFLAGE